MADVEYVKGYKDKELRQYVLAYLLVTIASIGFQTKIIGSTAGSFASLFQMIVTDFFVGAICILVLIFNELWPDRIKTKLIYKTMPSDTIFSDISSGKIDATGFDINSARSMYAALASESAAKQTSEWNILLRKARDEGRGNVIEAQRMQLLTRDICMSTVSLLILNVIAVVVLTIVYNDVCLSIKMFSLPLIYLVAMFFITQAAARNRGQRFAILVIKNDVQNSIIQST